MEVVVTTSAIRRANLQSKCHHQRTNIQLFTDRMPFLSPNQQCQSTEGKLILNPGLVKTCNGSSIKLNVSNVLHIVQVRWSSPVDLLFSALSTVAIATFCWSVLPWQPVAMDSSIWAPWRCHSSWVDETLLMLARCHWRSPTSWSLPPALLSVMLHNWWVQQLLLLSTFLALQKIGTHKCISEEYEESGSKISL